MGVGKMGIGKIGQIIGKTGVGEMGVGEMGVILLPYSVTDLSTANHLPVCFWNLLMASKIDSQVKEEF